MKYTPLFIQTYQSQAEHIRQELLDGLRAGKAYTSPKYLYDELGSKLFEAITAIPEYYPTRTEKLIFNQYKADLARQIPPASAFIDLGAGNCKKAALLFDALHPARYIAVDISVEFLKEALNFLQCQFPEMEMAGVGMDFSNNLSLPAGLALNSEQPKVMFYPGSSIGNFSPEAAFNFLRQVHAVCSSTPGSGLLIGVDLIKNTDVLEAAYDDMLGVSAAFNHNILLHFNALAGTNFQVEDWKHVATYNHPLSRIEMHLEATRDLTVSWENGERHFVAGERIHTEDSYKWALPQFENLLKQAGFSSCTAYTDPEQKFAVFWALA